MKVVALTFLEQVGDPRHCVWLRVVIQVTVFGLTVFSPRLWFE